MECRIDQIDLGMNSQFADLFMVMSVPATDIGLDVMKHLVETVESLLDCFAVMGMIGSVNVFCDLQDLVCFSVGCLVAVILRIIVMQVEAKFVGQSF